MLFVFGSFARCLLLFAVLLLLLIVVAVGAVVGVNMLV